MPGKNRPSRNSRKQKARRNKNGQRNARRKIPIAMAMLSQHYPELFNKSSPVPLAIGIHKEIKGAIPSMPFRVLKAFMWWWTHRREYLQAICDSQSRVHLDGRDAGEIGDVERGVAIERIADLRERKQSKLEKVTA